LTKKAAIVYKDSCEVAQDKQRELQIEVDMLRGSLQEDFAGTIGDLISGQKSRLVQLLVLHLIDPGFCKIC
jgi:hypothetical protein